MNNMNEWSFHGLQPVQFYAEECTVTSNAVEAESVGGDELGKCQPFEIKYAM